MAFPRSSSSSPFLWLLGLPLPSVGKERLPLFECGQLRDPVRTNTALHNRGAMMGMMPIQLMAKLFREIGRRGARAPCSTTITTPRNVRNRAKMQHGKCFVRGLRKASSSVRAHAW